MLSVTFAIIGNNVKCIRFFRNKEKNTPTKHLVIFLQTDNVVQITNHLGFGWITLYDDLIIDIIPRDKKRAYNAVLKVHEYNGNLDDIPSHLKPLLKAGD